MDFGVLQEQCQIAIWSENLSILVEHSYNRTAKMSKTSTKKFSMIRWKANNAMQGNVLLHLLDAWKFMKNCNTIASFHFFEIEGYQL